MKTKFNFIVIAALLLSFLLPFSQIKAQENFDSYIDDEKEKIIISAEGAYVELTPLTQYMFEHNIGVIEYSDIPSELKKTVANPRSKESASADGEMSMWSSNGQWFYVAVIHDSQGNVLFCLDSGKEFPNGNGYTVTEMADNQGLYNLMAKGLTSGVSYADIQAAVYAYLAEQAGATSFYFGGTTIQTSNVRAGASGWLVQYGHDNNVRHEVILNTTLMNGVYNETDYTVEYKNLVVSGFNGAFAISGLPSNVILRNNANGNVLNPLNIPGGTLIDVVNTDPSKEVKVTLSVTSLEGKNSVGVYYTSLDGTKQNLGRFKDTDPIKPKALTMQFDAKPEEVVIVKLDKYNLFKKLPGATIKVDRILEDSTLETVGTFVSNSQGVFKNADATKLLYTEDLVAGKYVSVETSAPDGYVLDTTPYYFEVTPDMVKEYGVTTFFMFNEPGEKVELIKANSKDQSILLPGAEGELFQVINTNGVITEKSLGMVKSNEEGKILPINLDTTQASGYNYLLAKGDYFFDETKAPFGYKLPTERFAFTITDAQILDNVDTKIIVTNDRTTYKIKGLKVDELTGEVLAGAGITIYDADMKVLDEKVSGKDGLVEYEVTAGKYYFKETKAPQGYLLSDEIIEVTIAEGEEIPEVEFKLTNSLLPVTVLQVTGQQATLVFLGAALALAGSGTLIARKKMKY